MKALQAVLERDAARPRLTKHDRKAIRDALAYISRLEAQLARAPGAITITETYSKGLQEYHGELKRLRAQAQLYIDSGRPVPRPLAQAIKDRTP